TTTSYTVGATPATETVQDILTALGSADMTATVVGGKIQLNSTNYLDSISVSGSGAGASGFGTANTEFAPTNLLAQGITAGQTLTITVGGTPTTITFGTGAGQASTLTQPGGLLSKLQGIAGISSASIDSNGNISMTALSTSDDIVVGSSAGTEVSP